ncbi:MAG: glycine--tRNA ligase subunit beta [bacterium]
MADLLVEIGTEDLPPAEIRPVLEQLRDGLRSGLDEARLDVGDIGSVGTPRRLVVFASGLARRQRPEIREVRGPAAAAAFDAADRPTAAALGFARSQGIPVDRLQFRDIGGRRYTVAVVEDRGQPAATVLPAVLGRMVDGLTFSRGMRWGDGDARFLRPVRWVVALLGTRVLRVIVAGVKAGRTTRGHRFLSPRPRRVARAADYFRVMKGAHVVLDPSVREKRISLQARALAAKAGGAAQLDPDLLDETVMSVEHPQALSGEFDREFLSLPAPVLVTVMEHHQKYFPVTDNAGGLRPAFIAVRDGDRRHLPRVREGHEWVLRARLADARFFFDEDSKRRLEERVGELDGLTFLPQVGTMAQKTQRLIALAEYLAVALVLDGRTAETLTRAAALCKADLLTHMVGEFPELQGVMGGIYAGLDGEPPPVAQAIGEHYLPGRTGDRIPSTLAGNLLGLVDRADTLIGGIATGHMPTGSEDPYALRRAAQGMVEIVLGHRIQLPLSDFLEAVHGELVRIGVDGRPHTVHLALDLLRQRARAFLVERGIRYDAVDAALAVSGEDLVSGAARARTIADALGKKTFPRLFVAYDRASRILSGEPTAAVDPGLFEDDSERDLAAALASASPAVSAAASAGDFRAALDALVPLADPVDRLFDAVLVMAPDPRVRANRQALLRAVVDVFRRVGDFSKIVMETRTGVGE